MDLDDFSPATRGAAAGAAVVSLKHPLQRRGQTLEHRLVTVNSAIPEADDVKYLLLSLANGM